MPYIFPPARPLVPGLTLVIAAICLIVFAADGTFRQPAHYNTEYTLAELCLLALVCYLMHRQDKKQRRIQTASEVALLAIENNDGNLRARLRDGTIRIVSLRWIAAMAREGWILQRRQDLPEAAFIPIDESVGLLLAGRVCQLSYRWLSAEHPDPDRFHVRAVAEWYGSSRWAYDKYMGVFWDFASLPQKDASGFRSEADTAKFHTGLKLMSALYAHPETLVVQHKRLSPECIARGSNPYDSSGWCNFEQAVAGLLVERRPKLFEIGVDTRPRRPSPATPRSPDELSAFFADEARCHFYGRADRETVAEMYRTFYAKVASYDKHFLSVAVADATSEADSCCGACCSILFNGGLLFVAASAGAALGAMSSGNWALFVSMLPACAGISFGLAALRLLPSRHFQAKVRRMCPRLGRLLGPDPSLTLSLQDDQARVTRDRPREPEVIPVHV